MRLSFLRLASAVLLGAVLFLIPVCGTAQQLIIKGEFGLMSGSMPPPGFYAGAFGSLTWADEIRGPDGEKFSGPELDQQAFGPPCSGCRISRFSAATTASWPSCRSRIS